VLKCCYGICDVPGKFPVNSWIAGNISRDFPGIAGNIPGIAGRAYWDTGNLPVTYR